MATPNSDSSANSRGEVPWLARKPEYKKKVKRFSILEMMEETPKGDPQTQSGDITAIDDVIAAEQNDAFSQSGDNVIRRTLSHSYSIFHKPPLMKLREQEERREKEHANSPAGRSLAPSPCARFRDRLTAGSEGKGLPPGSVPVSPQLLDRSSSAVASVKTRTTARIKRKHLFSAKKVQPEVILQLALPSLLLPHSRLSSMPTIRAPPALVSTNDSATIVPTVAELPLAERMALRKAKRWVAMREKPRWPL